MTVHKLPKALTSNTSDVLRAVADENDAGAYGKVVASISVLEDDSGNLHLFGSGAADYYRGLALLQLATSKMTRDRNE